MTSETPKVVPIAGDPQVEPEADAKAGADGADAAGSSPGTHSKMLACSLIGALVAISFLLYLVLSSNSSTAFEVATLSGLLGAFMSSLVRLYSGDSPKVLGAVNQPGLKLFDIAIYSFVPAIVGAISAGVIYVLFAAGIMEGGAFFPTFACSDSSACNSFHGFMEAYSPKGPTDHAKLLIWCFIAGFAERLVPDKLKGLIDSVNPGS